MLIIMSHQAKHPGTILVYPRELKITFTKSKWLGIKK